MNTKLYVKNPSLAKPWVYFSATYVWTWIFFGICYALGVSAESGSTSGVILVLLALSGPSLMGIIFAYLTLNKEGVRDFWLRVFDFKRISFKFYLAIFLLIPLISLIAALLSGYWRIFFFTHKLPSLYLTLLSVPLVPILEELGWRGYVLDRLQEKYSAFASSIILGVMWGLWHTPAFFLQSSIFNLMPFAFYVFHAVFISFIFTWIYNNTGRSTLSAILLHIVLEFCANTTIIPWDRPEAKYNLGVLVVFVIILSYIYGYAKLSRTIKDK